MKLQFHTCMTVRTFITFITFRRLAPFTAHFHHWTCRCSVTHQQTPVNSQAGLSMPLPRQQNHRQTGNPKIECHQCPGSAGIKNRLLIYFEPVVPWLSIWHYPHLLLSAAATGTRRPQLQIDISCPQGKKGKVFPYSLPSVGPGADPGVQAVGPQVTWSESRHIPSSSLPLLSARPAFTFVAFTRWRYL